MELLRTYLDISGIGGQTGVLPSLCSGQGHLSPQSGQIGLLLDAWKPSLRIMDFTTKYATTYPKKKAIINFEVSVRRIEAILYLVLLKIFI